MSFPAKLSLFLAGGASWVAATLIATWSFNRRVRRLNMAHPNTNQLLPVSRRAGGERARCQSRNPTPRRQRARQFFAKSRSL